MNRDEIKQERDYKAVIVYDNGDVLQCHIENFLPNGPGRKIYKDLGVYEGEFADGKEEGNAKYTAPDGRIYMGLYKDGKQEGMGEEIWPNNDRFTGEYKNGVKEGNGILSK